MRLPDELGINGFLLQQDEENLRLGTDAVVLSEFARVRPGQTVCDLGAGTGAVSILLAARNPDIFITAVEILPGAARLLSENIRINRLEARMSMICGDLREESLFSRACFDAVVSNPPYMKAGAGLLAPKPALASARCEINATILDVCMRAAFLLKPGRPFFTVYRPERLSELFSALESARLVPKRVMMVHGKITAPPCLVLTEARSDCKPGIKFEPPLIIRNSDGSETEQLKAYYRR